MSHPQNYRVYGVLLRGGKVLVAAEYIEKFFVWKFPGGGVAEHETAMEALVREFREEASMAVAIGPELHDPGTLVSPMTRVPYTPVFFLVESLEEPRVPEGEELELSFMEIGVFLESDLVAEPEKVALRAAGRLRSRPG